MTASRRIIIFSVLFTMMVAAPCFAGDDFQYWSDYSVKVIDTDHIDLTAFADLRMMEDAGKAGLYYVSERLSIDYWKWFKLGLNYTYLNSRSTSPDAVDDSFNRQHRLEAEFNPHWGLGPKFKLDLRNRAEFRWIESKGSYNTRFRQRTKLTMPLKTRWPLQSIYTSGEMFYNIAEHAYDENRMVPFGVNMKLTEKMSLDLYYMIQSKKGVDSWSSNQILGSTFLLSF